MSKIEDLRKKVLGKPTVLDLDIDGDTIHARLPNGGRWQEMIDKLDAVQKEKDGPDSNARMYAVMVWVVACCLCDPESGELLFDASNEEDLELLAKAEGGRVQKTWKAILESQKEVQADAGKESGPTEVSSSG